MSKAFVNLDYAASAPLSAVAAKALDQYEQQPYAGANPNSLHTMGRQAARAMDGARRDIIRAMGGGFRPADVVFTSGGTESNNLALLGLAEAARERDRLRNTVVIPAIEHDSVLDVAPVLRNRGFDVVTVQPNRLGVVTPDAIAQHLGRNTALVTLMSANNETGVVQPVGEVATLAHKAGALVHTDAVQAFGRIRLQLDDVDAVSVAAHKIGGPVGVGALVCRQRVHLRPQSHGGGQEGGRRAGTQDVRGALAFAAVSADCSQHLEQRRAEVIRLAEALIERVCTPQSGIVPTVPFDQLGSEGRLAGIVNVIAPGVDSETLVLECDQAGFEVSAASACSSGSLDASHVLLAMGVPRNEALCSLRISFDERVAQQDLEAFGDALLGIVQRRRRG